MLKLPHIFVVFFCCFFFAEASGWAKDRQVVIIPGIMGSKLCDKDNHVIWGDRYSYTFSRINALRLPANPDQRDKSIHSCGLIDSINIIPILWETDQYNLLIDFLVRELKYEWKDILIFDYDWRLSNRENAQLLSRFIADNKGTGEVDVLAYSMGGIIARLYIQEYGGGSTVHDLILLGTPQLGSTKIFFRLKDGFDNWPSAFSGGIEEIQKTILSFPSTYQLLPTNEECCAWSASGEAAGADYIKDMLQFDVWTRLHWVPAEFRTGSMKAAMRAHLAEAESVKTLMKQPIFNPSQDATQVHYVANGFVNTWSRVFFEPETGKVTGHTENSGDGTVSLYSATNGSPERFQISSKTHEIVFSGKEAELVLRTSLIDRKTFTSALAFTPAIKDVKGQTVSIDLEGVDVAPRVATPQTDVAVIVSLTGKQLADVQLAPAEVSLIKADGTRQVVGEVAFRTEDEGVSGKLVLKAPDENGPYKVIVNVPGLEPVEAIFAVMVP